MFRETYRLTRSMTLVLVLSLILALLILNPGTSVLAASREVTKTADTDDGVCNSDCSLREAVDVAGSGDVITFDPSLSGDTILLTSTINIAESITIDGSSLTDHIKISGGDSIRIFYINSGYNVTFTHIALIDGYSSFVSGAGAIYNNSSATLTISNTIFSGNTADHGGGAINNLGALNISNSTFIENTANSGGGIYSSGTQTISNSTFYANTGLYASAVFDFGTSTVYNSTFYQNTNTGTNFSGAYYVAGTSTTIVNCTFSDNDAVATYPAALGKSSGHDLHLKNSILANSTSGVDAYCTDSLPSDVNNVIEYNSGCGTPISTVDPKLEPLADNGGPTQTMSLNWGSPAIDSGDPSTCADAGTINNLDQRGFPRPVDAVNDGNAVCDIGAYEIQMRYVRTTGNDTSNDCTNLSASCLTVEHAVDQAISCDTVNVGEGTFITADTIHIGKDLSIIGAGMDLTRIDGNGTHTVLNVSSSPLVLLIGLNVQNGTSSTGPGGIHNSGQLVLSRVKVTGNTTLAVGGGIYSEGELDIINSTISDNHTTGTNKPGGGIFLNSSDSSGIMNSTFSGNTATGASGGIHCQGGATLDLDNVTISGNTAYSGAGMTSTASSTVAILNSTITDNHLSSGGYTGGINNYSTLNIKNSIIAGNDGNQCIPSGTWTSDGYNISSDANCVFSATGDQENIDPLLAPLADYGGYTDTHALYVGSPAIDAGDDVDCPATDQRGVSRPQGSHCDIGAYEGSITPDEDNPGFYKPSGLKWYLKNDQVDGWSNYTSFKFGGDPNLLAVTGDWDNDGTDTVGFYYPVKGKWYLKNNQTDGWTDYVTVKFAGVSGAIPVAGDWNNDGQDTIGFYLPSGKKWYLKDNLVDGWGGVTPVRFGGASDWQPVTGDWDDDGQDTIGFYLPATGKWYLKNSLVDGWSSYVPVKFKGVSGAEAVSGNWDASGGDTIGFYVQSGKKWYFKNNLVDGWAGVSNMRWGGDPDWQPVTGDWQ